MFQNHGELKVRSFGVDPMERWFPFGALMEIHDYIQLGRCDSAGAGSDNAGGSCSSRETCL